MTKEKKEPKNPKAIHAVIVFVILIGTMCIAILKYDAGVHVPMFCGVVAAAVMALYLGFEWQFIETSMMKGIYNALQAVMILMIVGVLIGVWIAGGVVPAMIYYGLKLLSPSVFLLATLLICSITSLATGTSWGTMGTMGLALIGISVGLGIPVAMTAGAIISGAYFGDKMSPLSDTTNLAPAMAGTDVMTHISFMLAPTGLAYGIAAVTYTVMGITYANSGKAADMTDVQIMSDGLADAFNINPVLLLPPVIVIAAVAFKIPAIPGITLGIIAGAIVGPIFQGDACNAGVLLSVGYEGFTSNTGIGAIDELLTSGGITNMLYSVSLTVIAMMFGGIMEHTGMLAALVNKIVKLAKTPAALIGATELTCVLSNVTMPEQYISVVVPGRMYAETYEKMELHPKTLSNALESAGTVTSALVPWNTCGVFIYSTLGVSTFAYFGFAIFNWLMPIVTLALAFTGYTIANKDGIRMTRRNRKKLQNGEAIEK